MAPANPLPKGSDLKPETQAIINLDWSPAKTAESLRSLFSITLAHATNAIDWYLHARKSKRRMAYLLRFCAILFTAAAGVIPLLVEPLKNHLDLNPAYASLALAGTALCLSFDRFFGFSTSWLRFIQAEQDIRKVLQEFQLDWQAETVAVSTAPTPENARRMIGAAKIFMNKVNDIIRQETQLWVVEFQDTLRQLDQAAKAREVALQMGIANLTVTNGDQTDGEWSVSVDNGSPCAAKGRTVVLPQLSPGSHVFRVTGKLGGKVCAAETAAVVPANGVVEVSVTLCGQG